MAKLERGLPKSFDIKVPDGPVRLGDYLDEAPAAVMMPPPPPPAAATEAPPPPAAIETANFVAPPPAAAVPAPAPAALSPLPPRPAARRASPPRKQFNMAPETLRMLDELLVHVRSYSSERDVRASELVHALVMAMHEVRPYLDLTSVPPRGKWGSPGAAALPVALKDAFQKAVAKSRAGR